MLSISHKKHIQDYIRVVLHDTATDNWSGFMKTNHVQAEM